MRKTKQRVIFSLFILSICYGITMAADSPCGDWEPYKDEKCFKIIDETLRTYDDAEKTCNQQENSATLVIIHSKEEQDFLSNLLFKTHKVVDKVWIGVKYNSNKFKWIDNSELSFTNWVKGSPKNKTDYGCVQMQSEETSVGKWIDEPCKKKNLVACQKMQNWSISRLQKTLLDARKELQDSLEDVRKRLNNHESTINNLKQNPVPIGFIYVQLPSQPEPSNLWPSVKWQSVSSNYSGHFFRVEGGNAASFGGSQLDAFQGHDHSENSLIDVSFTPFYDSASRDDAKAALYVPNHTKNWSHSIVSDKVSGMPRYAIETRPINYSIRIWKRVS